MNGNEERLVKNVGIIIKGLRERKNMTQDGLARATGISKTNISYIESATNSNNQLYGLKINQLFKICKALDVNYIDILRYAESQKEMLKEISMEEIGLLMRKDDFSNIQFDKNVNATIDHQRRLQKYPKIELTCFYTSTEENSNSISEFSITTEEICKSGYIPLSMKVGSHEYLGKIISPPDGDYTYFYLDEQSDRAERAILSILHHKGGKLYQGGVGCLFSLSRGLKRVLCMQKVVLFNKKVLNKLHNLEIDELNRYLKFKNGICDNKLYIDCLKKLDAEWYAEFIRKKE